MRYWVGFDVGKAFHRVCVLDEEGEVILSRRVEAEEQDIESCYEEIKSLGGDRMVATDLLGGPAALLEAILIDRGERVFHLPGTAVNRARDGYRGEPQRDPITDYRVYTSTDVRDAHLAHQLRRGGYLLRQIAPLIEQVRHAGGVAPLEATLDGWRARLTARGTSMLTAAAELSTYLEDRGHAPFAS